MKNIIERPIVPYNPPASRATYKEGYSLFAPKVSNGKPGIAAFDINHFVIQGQTVKISTNYLDGLYVKRVSEASVIYGTTHLGLPTSYNVEHPDMSLYIPTADTVVRRGVGGDVIVPNNPSDRGAINKNYADANLASKLSFVRNAGKSYLSLLNTKNGELVRIQLPFDEIPLVVSATLEFGKTHEQIVAGMFDAVTESVFNKTPLVGDIFTCIAKSGDNYVYGITAEITDEKNIAGNYQFKITEVVLLHDGDAHKKMRLDYDTSSHVIRLVSTDQDGHEYELSKIDIPLESAITNIEESKNTDGQPILIFTLQNGKTTEVLLDDIFDVVSKTFDGRIEKNAADISTLSNALSELINDVASLDERLYNNEQYTEGINQTLNDLIDSSYGRIPQLEDEVDILERNKADKSVVEDHEERIEQLESLSLRYIEDTSVWHTKDVPNDVGKKALVDMIGGMSHTSNNRLPFPYPNMYDNEQNGVSITYNRDGSITLNGVLKAPNQIDILLYEDYSNPLSVDGVFTIGVDLPEACSFLSIPELDDNGVLDNPEQFSYPQEVKTSLMWKFHYLQISFGAWAEKDVTFDNYTFYPMYNEGGTPLKFEPYIEGVKHAKVKAIRSMVDGKVLSSVDVPKEIYDRADWGLGVSAEACNYIDLENDTYHSDYFAYTFNGSEQWNDPTTNGKKRFSCALGNLGCALPHFIDNHTVTSAISNGYTSVSASANYNQHSKSFAFGRTSLFVFDENIQDLDAWLEHLQKNPLTVVYEKAVKDVIKLSGIAQEDKVLVMDTDEKRLIADNDENLPAPSTITYVVHRGL